MLLRLIIFIVLINCSLAEDVPATKFKKTPYEETLNVRVRIVLDEHSSRAGLSSIKNSTKIGNQEEQHPPPVLLWHGMGDTAYGSLDIVRQALQRYFPGIAVYSVQVGGNAVEDVLGGYFVNVNYQIEQVCKEILANDVIKGFGVLNAVGFSQGAQFLRGLVQRCPLLENGIRVGNLVSLGGQHQGVYGLPNCYKTPFCDYIRYMLTEAAYEKEVQEHLVQAEYWHDPNREEEYKNKNIFIADINNELNNHPDYKERLSNLSNFVLVQFNEDEMVIPRESSLFGFYKPNQTKEIVSMEDSQLFSSDCIGLRTLAENQRLTQIRVPGNHLQFSITWFIDIIALNYLSR